MSADETTSESDPAAAVARVASLFQSLNRLRDAGYGASIIAAKVAECRAAVASLPPDVRAKVVALVNAMDAGGEPVEPDIEEVPFGLLDLPPPVLALCCVFAGDSGSLVPRLACACRAGKEVRPEILQSLYAIGTRVLLHSLKADTLNLRRGTVVQCETAEDRVGVRLDGDVKAKSVRRANVRLERGPRETGEPDELHEGFWCDGCGHFRGLDSPASKSLKGTRYRCTRCSVIPGFDLCGRCFGKGVTHACSASPALSHITKKEGPQEFCAEGFQPLKDSQATAFAKWVEEQEGDLDEREVVRQCMVFGGERGPRSEAVINSVYCAQFPGKDKNDLKSLRSALMREDVDAQIQTMMANAMGGGGQGPQPQPGPLGGQGPIQFGGVHAAGPQGVMPPGGWLAAAAAMGGAAAGNLPNGLNFGDLLGAGAAGGGAVPPNLAELLGEAAGGGAAGAMPPNLADLLGAGGLQFGGPLMFGNPIPMPGGAGTPGAADVPGDDPDTPEGNPLEETPGDDEGYTVRLGMGAPAAPTEAAPPAAPPVLADGEEPAAVGLLPDALGDDLPDLASASSSDSDAGPPAVVPSPFDDRRDLEPPDAPAPRRPSLFDALAAARNAPDAGPPPDARPAPRYPMLHALGVGTPSEQGLDAGGLDAPDPS